MVLTPKQSPRSLAAAIVAVALLAAFAAAPAQAAPRKCKERMVTADLGKLVKKGDTRRTRLTLTNKTRVTCRVRGYVGFTLADASGGYPTLDLVEKRGKRRWVKLAPGRRAATTLIWSVSRSDDERSAGRCRVAGAKYAIVTLPGRNVGNAATAWRHGAICRDGRVVVTPLRKG